MNESAWKISNGNMHIGHEVKHNNLYPLTVIGQEGSLNREEMPNSRMWHGGLAHMSQTGLWRLMALGYIPDLQHTESDFCEYCQYGKQTRSTDLTLYETVENPACLGILAQDKG